jgi:hypothetical protein
LVEGLKPRDRGVRDGKVIRIHDHRDRHTALDRLAWPKPTPAVEHRPG